LAAFDSKRIYYPKVPKSAHGVLEFYSVASLAELELGFMAKIPEPGLKSKRPKAALGEIDIVVVPGVGFDGEGYRLGFGKGYYDRTLKTYEGLVIGLAYDFQIVDRLPRESHDARCDWVVSESRIYRRD
jgi:5-formyltetrahydrofolate cyclo-ligase